MKINLKNKKQLSILIAGFIIFLTLIFNFFVKNNSHMEQAHNHENMKHNLGDGSMTNSSEGEVQIIKKENAWTCSMHPQVRQSESGPCPICGMDLIPVESESTTKRKIKYWQAPMDPSYKKDGPGKSPMGMDLVPVYEEVESDPTSLEMTEEAIKMASIQTTEITQNSVSKNINLLGKIFPDERRIFSQTSHFPGRVERVYLNFTGESVRRKQPIVSIYSPELVTAQKELFQTFKFKDINPNLYQATVNKLKNWKLSQRQIENILKKQREQINFTVFSDTSGVVMKKMVNSGDYVSQGSILYEIVDLKKVWALFEVYEKDLSWIKIKDEIDFEVSSLPGKSFKSKVTFIDPIVDPVRRIVSVRAEVDNRNLVLKPEMLVNGHIKSKLMNQEETVVVPKSAVLWTGKRSIVYIKVPDRIKPTFKMQEVVLGNELQDSYIIQEGLEEGEEIVTNGAFTIDAAAQLRGKPSMMNLQITMKPNEKKKTPEKTFETVETFQKQFLSMLSGYLNLKNAFVHSNTEEVIEKAKITRNLLDQVNMRLVKGETHIVWMEYLEKIEEQLDKIVQTESIEDQRSDFMKLSKNIVLALKVFNIKNSLPLFVQVCPMAKDKQGKQASWLSEKKEIKNPYYGEAMLTCGDVVETLH